MLSSVTFHPGLGLPFYPQLDVEKKTFQLFCKNGQRLSFQYPNSTHTHSPLLRQLSPLPVLTNSSAWGCFFPRVLTLDM
jgi:hypothetical protein